MGPPRLVGRAARPGRRRIVPGAVPARAGDEQAAARARGVRETSSRRHAGRSPPSSCASASRPPRERCGARSPRRRCASSSGRGPRCATTTRSRCSRTGPSASGVFAEPRPSGRRDRPARPARARRAHAARRRRPDRRDRGAATTRPCGRSRAPTTPVSRPRRSAFGERGLRSHFAVAWRAGAPRRSRWRRRAVIYTRRASVLHSARPVIAAFYGAALITLALAFEHPSCWPASPARRWPRRRSPASAAGRAPGALLAAARAADRDHQRDRRPGRPDGARPLRRDAAVRAGRRDAGGARLRPAARAARVSSWCCRSRSSRRRSTPTSCCAGCGACRSAPR